MLPGISDIVFYVVIIVVLLLYYSNILYIYQIVTETITPTIKHIIYIYNG